MLSPCFIPESEFYTQSVMFSPRFIPESMFYTQSVVHSPQSIFYTDRNVLLVVSFHGKVKCCESINLCGRLNVFMSFSKYYCRGIVNISY